MQTWWKVGESKFQIRKTWWIVFLKMYTGFPNLESLLELTKIFLIQV